MRTILRLLGHGVGFAGVMIGIGAIIRAVSASALRSVPYVHGITSLSIGGPLSIALIAIAAVLLGGDGGR